MAFVDTSFFVAKAIGRDRHHAEAEALATSNASRSLATSNVVLGETWTTLLRPLGRRRAVDWLDAVMALPSLRVVRVDAEIEEEAWAWLRIHDERPYSFVDATSFAVMRRLRLTDALAFDGDFTAAGFAELRPPDA